MMIWTVDKGKTCIKKSKVFSISGSEKDLSLLSLLVDKSGFSFECLFSAMELGVSVDGMDRQECLSSYENERG